MVNTITPMDINFESITIFDLIENNKVIINEIIDSFIDSQFEELEEEGSLALEYAEEENDYRLTAYWISGTYDVSYN